MAATWIAGRDTRAAPPAAPAVWPGEDAPLPLAVRTPQELALKIEAERQYLIFNLLAGGKVAYDAGDVALAVKKWEALLRLPELPASVDKAVRPLLQEAQRARGAAASSGDAGQPPSIETPPPPPLTVAVSGRISGGGALGPGGTVVWLKRLDGPTPRPHAGRRRVIGQRNKAFVPRVLAVTVGTTVDFRNDDSFFHNVFSLAETTKFDTGLYKAGGVYSQTFTKPGLVALLCNIHASMMGFVYVVDSPYYAQATGDGAFTIRGVRPGIYELSAWHEAAADLVHQRVEVDAKGAQGVALTIPADKRPSVFVPDKYGKPRQPNVGY